MTPPLTIVTNEEGKDPQWKICESDRETGYTHIVVGGRCKLTSA